MSKGNNDQSNVKKPEPKAEVSQSKPSSGNVGAKVGCHATGCKQKDSRFNFCDEHFRQFKFGLIKKTGEPVSDYDKKLDHYQNWIKTAKVAN